MIISTDLCVFQVAGLALLTVIVLVAATLPAIPWRKCSKRAIVAGELILEKGEILVTKTFKEAAEKKLTEKLDTCVAAGQWRKCFDVAEEVILEVSAQPTRADLEMINLLKVVCPLPTGTNVSLISNPYN